MSAGCLQMQHPCVGSASTRSVGCLFHQNAVLLSMCLALLEGNHRLAAPMANYIPPHHLITIPTAPESGLILDFLTHFKCTMSKLNPALINGLLIHSGGGESPLKAAAQPHFTQFGVRSRHTANYTRNTRTWQLENCVSIHKGRLGQDWATLQHRQ